jgi:hypothetical protein
MMRKRPCAVLVASAIVAASSAPTRAWRLTAHTVINRAAVAALPADVPAFLKRHIDWIGARSQAPDLWRDATEPYLKAAEDPNHGWYIEHLPPLPRLPASRNEFIRTVPDAGATGLLPYATVETFERLKVAFRTWRSLAATHDDTSFVELDAAFYAGWLGHYVADGAMPLHTSQHHDGWVGDNPHGYTRDRSIHGRFEGDFVDLIGLREEDVAPRMSAPATVPDAMAAFLAYLGRSHARVEQVYALDKQGAFRTSTNRDARELVYRCTADAASMLRDLMYTAWTASA